MGTRWLGRAALQSEETFCGGWTGESLDEVDLNALFCFCCCVACVVAHVDALTCREFIAADLPQYKTQVVNTEERVRVESGAGNVLITFGSYWVSSRHPDNCYHETHQVLGLKKKYYPLIKINLRCSVQETLHAVAAVIQLKST